RVDGQRRQPRLAREPVAETLGQIRHLLERRRSLVVQPAKELPGAEGLLAHPIDQPRQFLERERAQLGAIVERGRERQHQCTFSAAGGGGEDRPAAGLREISTLDTRLSSAAFTVKVSPPHTTSDPAGGTR